MRSKKLLVIIPDGVSLRNFVYTDFPKELEKIGYELVYMNLTKFDLTTLGYKEIKLVPKPKPWTDLLKRAKILSEIKFFKKKFHDPIYDKYKFSPATNGLKNKVKNFILKILVRIYGGENGLNNLRDKIKESEKGSSYYSECLKVISEEKPDLVFCANQRPVNALAPILAAEKSGIPTSCFIFSWDNLPKATKIIESDYYFVWSDFMKRELQTYYPYIRENQIIITGTPQFEVHYKNEILISRKKFYDKYKLDQDKQYVCFSGDDITTSPHDELFLLDLAEEVEYLNKRGYNLGIIFRRCPVDVSSRYKFVLDKFENIIVPIDPIWTNNQSVWNEIMPKKDDLFLQTNIVEHCLMVINVGSSMIFDFAAKKKPCAFISYIPSVKKLEKDIQEVYSYVHFRSMPKKQPVYWIRNKSEFRDVLLKVIEDKGSGIVENAEVWSNKINANMSNSSKKIVLEIKRILE